MFKTMKLIKFTALVAALASISLAATTPSQAQSCTIRLHIVKAGFIVGAGGGNAQIAWIRLLPVPAPGRVAATPLAAASTPQ